MRKDRYGRIILSRRNLLSLLHKLDMPGSSATLIAPGGEFIVKAEDDAEHYGNRTPGVMHPDTERFITEYSNATSRSHS